MDDNQVKNSFSTIMKEEKEVSVGIAAIRTLLMYLKLDKSVTAQELRDNINKATKAMTQTDYPTTAVVSGSELFLRFITLVALDNKPFEHCRDVMIVRGSQFLEKLASAREKISKLASGWIHDGHCILCHSKSRVVLQTLKKAKDSGCKFKIFVTKSYPDCSGDEMCADLIAYGIPCTVILDSAVGYVMEQVHMVLVGAEGIVESGGIINKVGSFTIAMCAMEMKKPFYVLAESFKFSRDYPLNQKDLPKEYKFAASLLDQDLEKEHPWVDYTPPSYISLIFSDLGILTPSAVSDELIKLYL